MVLDNSTNPPSSYPDAFPPSDSDLYDSSNPNTSNNNNSSIFQDGHILTFRQLTDPTNPTSPSIRPDIHINLNNVPRPIFAPSRLPPTAGELQGIQQSWEIASRTLHRPITQEEAEALAYHFGRGMRMGSYGLPAGLFGAGVMMAWTSKEMRFPFWSPFKENSRFKRERFGPLRGASARALWQAGRVTAWSFVGVVVAGVFFSSYGVSVAAVGRGRDPRLRDFNEAIRARMRGGVGREERGQGGLPGGREVDMSPGKKEGESHDMARQRRSAQEVWRRGRESGRQGVVAQRERRGDDASPTGGAFSDGIAEMTGGDGFLSEEEVARQADDRLRTAEDPASPSSTYQSNNTPIGAQAVSSREQPRRQSSSTWERLRQEAKSGSQGNNKNTSPSSSSSARRSEDTDSFSFSSNDAERQLAKSEAQKDFDARIEREREGRDFTEGKERGGWRR